MVAACGHKRGHGPPLQRSQIEPPHRARWRPCLVKPAAHHPPRQGAEPLLRPRKSRPAYPGDPPRSDEAAVLGDEGPDLDEGEDVLGGTGSGGAAVGGRHGIAVADVVWMESVR